jgi:exodeoxyribonuclease-3
MRIVTWNVNSVRTRLPHLLAYLGEATPDVMCLQELKCLDAQFPRAEVEALGYNVAVHGQKGFNGVAILSKRPVEAAPGLPGDEADAQARYLEATTQDADGRLWRVASIYAPNGNPLGTDKFPYKLAFLDRLIAHARRRLALEEPLVLTGDYNIIPEPIDARRPEAWTGDALFQPESRARFRALENLGLTDALRAVTRAEGVYTFWDYQAGAWQRNDGIRIDHALLSPEAADRLFDVVVDSHVRGWDKPSDHVPVRIEFR